LAGVPVARVLADDHGHVGDVVGGKQRVVAAVWLSFDSLTLCRGRRVHAKGKPLPIWAMTVMSMVVVPFLKASWGFSPSVYMLRVKTQDLRIGRWRHSGVMLFLKTPSWSPQHAALRWLCGGVSPFGNLWQGLLRALPSLSFLGAAVWFVGSVVWFPVVVSFRWRFCDGGVLSTARVFVGSL
jgi:hypothetical protein